MSLTNKILMRKINKKEKVKLKINKEKGKKKFHNIRG